MLVKDIIEKSKPVWVENERGKELQPKVTVVLPTYARAKSGRLELAIESVIEQTYQNWELIIVDDGSNDGTEDLIKFYMQLDPRISTIRHTYNMGLPAISEYEAYMKSRGEYIAYVFDDNVWEKNHLMVALKVMLKDKVKFTYGVAKSYGINDSAEIGGEVRYLPCNNCIGNAAVVIHKDIIETIGLYDPHISLTRLCDWDLWIRISKRYEMRRIPQIVTTEYGASLNDSLGNTLKLNAWTSFERMSEERNKMLLPCNFENINICEVSTGNTGLYSCMVNTLYLNYRKKNWYVEKAKECFEIDVKKAKKRVVLVVEDMDATYTLGFQNIMADVIIHPVFFSAFTEKDLLYADYVLFIRSTLLAMQFGQLCKKYGVPFGYYLDDNFTAMIESEDITEDAAEYAPVKARSDALLSTEMSMFRDVFMSTTALKKFYEERGIANIAVLPPCIDDLIPRSLNEVSDVITVAFMGGKFREKVFLETAFNVMLQCSKKQKYKLVCPDTLGNRIKECYEANKLEDIQIVSIPRLAYQECIKLYQKENVNILIHTGEEISNNKYKTLNALINATYLGAILMTSNIDPYVSCDAILKVDNNCTDWEAMLSKVVQDNELRIKQYEVQLVYVREHYGQNYVSQIFNEVTKDISSTSVSEIIDRQQKYADSLGQPAMNMAIPVSDTQMVDLSILQLGHQADEILERFLSFQAIPPRKLRYVVTPSAYMFNQIGLVMAYHERRGEGEVVLEVYDKKQCIATAKKNLKDIQARQVNYFQLSQMVSDKKKLKIVLSVNYENNATGMMGLYEVKDRKKMIYRICKKLTGRQLPVKNLPYIVLK